jgi:hypothetical protein
MTVDSVPEPDDEVNGVIEIDCSEYLSPELKAKLRIGKFVPVGYSTQRHGGDSIASNRSGADGEARSAAIETASALLEDGLASEKVAEATLRELANHFGSAPEDGMYACPSSRMNNLVRKMHRSRWQWLFERVLLDLFHARSAKERVAVGGLYGYLTDYTGDRDGAWYGTWVTEQVDTMCRASGHPAVAALLSLKPGTSYGFTADGELTPRLVSRLLEMLGDVPPAAHAAGEVLFYLQDHLEADRFRRRGVWQPAHAEVSQLVRFLAGPGVEAEGAGRWALGIVVAHPQGVDLSPVVERLRTHDPIMLRSLEWATGWPGDEQILGEIIGCLVKGEGLQSVRTLPISLSDPQQRIQLSRDKDGIQPWQHGRESQTPAA